MSGSEPPGLRIDEAVLTGQRPRFAEKRPCFAKNRGWPTCAVMWGVTNEPIRGRYSATTCGELQLTNEITLPAPAGATAFNYDAVDNLLAAHEAKEAAARIRARLNEQSSTTNDGVITPDREPADVG